MIGMMLDDSNVGCWATLEFSKTGREAIKSTRMRYHIKRGEIGGRPKSSRTLSSLSGGPRSETRNLKPRAKMQHVAIGRTKD